MKRYYVFIAMLILLACRSSDDSDTQDYVQGEIILGIGNLLPADSVFAIVNYYNHDLINAGPFFFKSPFSKDSLASLTNAILSKNYLSYHGFPPVYDTSRSQIAVNCYFVNLDKNDQIDWHALITRFQMDTLAYDVPKVALVRVPDGKEKYWIDKYENRPHVLFAELNYIMNLY